MQLILFNGMNTIISTVTTMPLEKSVFLREFRNGYYSVSPFFWSRILVAMMFQLFYMTILGIVTYNIIGLYKDWFSFFQFLGVFSLIGFIGIVLGCKLLTK